MPNYNELRILAFRLHQGVKTLPYSFCLLQFPEHWKRVLRDLQAEALKRESNSVRLPIDLLNTALKAFVPDLIFISYDVDKQENSRPWLYSEVEIDPQALMIIIHSWIRTAFPKASSASRQAAIASLQAKDLTWKKETIDLAEWKTNANGTAMATREDAFVLFPHLVAAQLSRPGVFFTYGTDHLHFRRVPLQSGRHGAELVSWPPISYRQGKNQWYYSIKLTFAVQTVPFQPYPALYCEIGVRRWAGPPIKELRRGNTSVYLLTGVPWIKGLHNSPHFGIAPLEEFVVSSFDATQQRVYSRKRRWGNSLAELIQDIQLQDVIPDPEILVKNPEQFLNLEQNQKIAAAVVYRYGMIPEHPVKPGIMPKERCNLLKQIAERLSPALVLVSPLKKIAHDLKRIRSPFFLDGAYTERRQRIAQAVGNALTFEIWHQPQGIEQLLIQVICEALGLSLPQEESNTYTWMTREINITIQKHSLGALGSPLALEDIKRSRRDRLHTAIHQRVEDIEKHLETVAGLGTQAAYIELQAANYFVRDTDPKYALRLGFAAMGRVTQFLTPPGDERDNVEHRARQAFLDLLRQLGVCLQLPQVPPLLKDAKSTALPANQGKTKQSPRLHYAAVWMIRQTTSASYTRMQQKLPVLVHISADTGQVSAIALGMSEWQPYMKTLCTIADLQLKGGQACTQQQALAFIREKIEEDIAPLGETLLLCQAQNIRPVWPWIGNNHITAAGIAFGGASQSPLTISGLHIVRVRGGDAETPQCYAQNETREGFARGIFTMGERVFASTHSNPPQFKISRSLSKAPQANGMSQAAAKPAWNPGLYELTVVGSPEGEAWQWATLAHELRQAALHYEEATALPLPLHLAKGIEQYSSPLSDQGDDVVEDSES